MVNIIVFDHISFPLNHHNGIEQVDYYFSRKSEFEKRIKKF